MPLSDLLGLPEEQTPEAKTDVEVTHTPEWLQAADLHNLGNRNPSLIGSEDEPWIGSANKFIRSSIASGVNEIYNMSQTVGSWLGKEPVFRTTEDYLQQVDSSLTDYYLQHQDTVDIVGFGLTSLIPGTAGMKALNVGQKVLSAASKTGKIGKTLSKATGLLSPKHDELLFKAIQETASSKATFSFLRGNTLKALGAGFTQNTLEAAAFEVAVAATMYNSPVLEHMDTEDMFWNMALGAGLGGAIGGTLSGIYTFGKIKRGVLRVEEAAAPQRVLQSGQDALLSSDKAALLIHSKSRLPGIPAKTGVPETDLEIDKMIQVQKQTLRSYQESFRKEMSNFTNGDETLAHTLYENLSNQETKDALNILIQSEGAARVAVDTATEKELRKLGKKVGAFSGEATEEEVQRFGNLAVRYLKVHGPDAGKIFETQPTALTLADTLRPGQSISVKGNKVTAGARTYQFDYKQDWNIFTKEPYEVEARYIWAEKSPALPEGIMIHENDIPILTKAYKEGIAKIVVKGEDGFEATMDATSREFTDFLIHKKHDVGYRLSNATKEFEFPSLQAKIDYLKKELKIDFTPVDIPPDWPELIAGHISELRPGHLEVLFEQQGGKLKQIIMNKKYLRELPMSRLIQALKHEQGHSFYQPIVDIGGLDIDLIPSLRAELIPISKRVRPEQWKNLDQEDYLINARKDPSTLASLHELMADAFAFASMHPQEARRLAPTWWSQFGENIHPVPQRVLDAIIAQKVKLTQEQIAQMVDVLPSVFSEVTESTAPYFARQAAREEYAARMVGMGIRSETEATPIDDLINKPSVVKVTYNREAVKGADGNVLEGMAMVQEKARLAQNAVDNVFTTFMPEGFGDKFTSYSTEDLFEVSVINSPARGFVTSANPGYAKFETKAVYNGQLTARARIAGKEKVHNEFAAPTYKLGSNTDAAIEWNTLHQQLANIPEHYTFAPTDTLGGTGGSQTLILERLKDYYAKVDDALKNGKDPNKIRIPEIDPDIPKQIHIKNVETADLLRDYMRFTDKQNAAHGAINAAQGGSFAFKEGRIYPIRPNPKTHKHFAFVVDNSVLGHERGRMIYAQTADDLADMISRVEKDMPASWKIYTKGEAERWYKAVGEFEFDKTIKDAEFDATLKRKGVSSPLIISTDPQKIVNDFMEHLEASSDFLVNRLVSAKFQPQFDSLIQMGEAYTSIATSVKGSSRSLLDYAENTVNNPFANYIKATLGLPNNAQFAWWFNSQKIVDQKLSQMFGTISELFDNPKSTTDDLLKINATLKEYGYKGPNYDEALLNLANKTVPNHVLANFSAKANAILANLVLRLDPLNAAVNTVSSHVLYYPEIRGIISAIEKGDKNAVGKLTELAKIKLPGSDEFILSPQKIHAKAIFNYWKALRNEGVEAGDDWIQMYRDYGYITRISDQYRHVIDELSFTGTETALELDSKITRAHNFTKKLAEKGEKLSGNSLAEEYNRFVAADSARMIFDIAAKHGIISKQEVWSNVNTFVNRTQGMYVAAFRPAILQGAIGQSIGLFQTYQFNLLQQLFRHVAEGDVKNAALMAGLQGTLFGVQGLPAFNAINTHILGTMSGNPEHKDMYYHVYNVANRDAADWIMYGAASNAIGLLDKDLRPNLYTRGDINPRHLTVVPTSFVDIPIVQAWTKVIQGTKAAIQNVANGGDVWNSFLFGIEHASVNRPLTGLAQIVRATDNPESLVYSTSVKGNIIASNDLYSLSNLTRLVGGKPFDQAIMQDLGYRMQVYAADAQEKKNNLGRAIKSSMYKGKSPSQEQIEMFAKQYVNIGGDQKTWNQFWMRQLTNSTQEQGERIATTLKTPALQKLQVLMGGDNAAKNNPFAALNPDIETVEE